MKHVGPLFAKLEHFLPLETRVRMILIPFLEKEYHILIPRKAIQVKQGKIFFDAEPAVRARILQKKQTLLIELQKKGVQEITTVL